LGSLVFPSTQTLWLSLFQNSTTNWIHFIFIEPLNKEELESIYEIIENSFFVLPRRQHLVKCAFKRLYDTSIETLSSLSPEEQKYTCLGHFRKWKYTHMINNCIALKFSRLRYHRSLVLLLPQLEHSLRRIFVAVNHLPECFLRAGLQLNFDFVTKNWRERERERERERAKLREEREKEPSESWNVSLLISLCLYKQNLDDTLQH
jgi:hypothetical protein